MRYVPKGTSPEFFEACKEDLPENSEWQHFTENKELSECKKLLHEHLVNEQGRLCIYCERKIDKDISHIEHIKPKDTSGQYAHLVFDYKNLVASCNGDLCENDSRKVYKPEDVHSCGHKKSNDFDEANFLNPVHEVQISEYFTFDKDSGAIAALNGNAKAHYTLNLLNLNNTRLCHERLKAPKALISAILSSNNAKLKSMSKAEQIKLLLNRNPPFPFISFLRAYFTVTDGKSV